MPFNAFAPFICLRNTILLATLSFSEARSCSSTLKKFALVHRDRKVCRPRHTKTPVYLGQAESIGQVSWWAGRASHQKERHIQQRVLKQLLLQCLLQQQQECSTATNLCEAFCNLPGILAIPNLQILGWTQVQFQQQTKQNVALSNFYHLSG